LPSNNFQKKLYEHLADPLFKTEEKTQALLSLSLFLLAFFFSRPFAAAAAAATSILCVAVFSPVREICSGLFFSCCQVHIKKVFFKKKTKEKKQECT